MLHCCKKDSPTEIIESLFRESSNFEPQNDSFNQRVMVALIEYDYINKIMSLNKGQYPNFLSKMLKGDYDEEEKVA